MRIENCHILRYLFIIMPLAWMFGSCSDGFGSGWGTDDGEAEVKIQLYTKTADALTRASLGETAASERELIKSWWVAFVDKNGKVAEIASNTLVDPVSMDEINTILPAGSYTAYAFANISQDSFEGKTKLKFTKGETAPSRSDIDKATINLYNGTIEQASGQDKIPMTGVLEIMAKGGINEPYAIEVVRLLGKVEFAFANATDTPIKVKSIGFGLLHEGPVPLMPDYDKLATPNDTGTAPEILDGSNVAGEIDGKTGLRYFGYEISDGGLEVTKIETNGIPDSDFENAEPFYVRETAIPGKSGADDATSDCCWFRLELEHGGIAKTVYAKVKDLTFINRNDHILIPVRLRLSTDHELTVDVLPYRSVILKPDFGLKLGALNLSKGVIRLYTDNAEQTASSGTVTALDENGELITEGLTWALGDVTDSHVCDINDNKDGTCTVKPIIGMRGRDVLIATIVKNGIEITDECIIEVSDRHLSLNKTFLGLTPQGNGTRHHNGEVLLDVVAETSDNSTLRWELLNEKGEPSDLDDIKVSVKADKIGEIQPGAKFPGDNAVISVTSGEKTGTAYLWFYYDNPDKAQHYESYCEIMVQEAVLNCFPTETSVIIGQTTTFTTTILPKFSDLIPSVKYHSSNPSVATVDENGVVTGVSVGEAIITVYNDTEFTPEIVSDKVKVNVTPNNLILMREDGVTNADEIEILSTEKVRIKAMSGGVDISSKVKWSVVEKDKFVTVTGGELTGAAATSNGTNTVLATYNYTDKDGKTTTLTARCVVVVSSERKLIIDEHAHGISINGEIPLKAHVFPDSRPSEQRKQTITWSSADESIISIKDNAYAEAKTYGWTTITATTTGNGGELLTASMKMEVMKEKEPLRLFIYDSKGQLVSEITSVDAYYPGPPAVTVIDDITNVGGLGLFDKISIPKGETWTARIILAEDTQGALTDAHWEKYQRYSFHKDRITLTQNGVDNRYCNITAKTMGEMGITTDSPANRYNEVIFKCKYKGKEYTRRFCVYTPDK